jgi:hypothetical protein
MSENDWRWGEFRRQADGTYSHQCGAGIARSGRLWISKHADGVTERQHSSLREATRYLYSHDPACWIHAPGFGSFQPSGRRLHPSGGLMLETGELEHGKVFTARTCERFPVEPQLQNRVPIQNSLTVFFQMAAQLFERHMERAGR